MTKYLKVYLLDKRGDALSFYINHAIWSGNELTDCNVCIASYVPNYIYYLH